jgi:hypothetical protein
MHIFHRIFLSNYWWQESDIWSQASYRYAILWEAFWTRQIPTSCLPTLLIFIHIEHTFCICPFLVAFFSATVDDRNLIFGHKLYIGTPYRGKRLLTRQIPTSCLPKSGGIISELAHSSSRLWNNFLSSYYDLVQLVFNQSKIVIYINSKFMSEVYASNKMSLVLKFLPRYSEKLLKNGIIYQLNQQVLIGFSKVSVQLIVLGIDWLI